MSNNFALILNYNDSYNSLRLGEKLEKMNFFDKIIIIDNNSSELEKKIINSNINKNILIIETHRNLMYAGGTNFGLNYIKSNYNAKNICIINSDVLIEKDVIHNCIDLLQSNEEIACCTAVMLDYQKKIDPIGFWNEYKYFDLINSCFFLGRQKLKKRKQEFIQTGNLIYCDCVRGSFQMFKAEDIYNIGCYDTNVKLYYEEDIIGKKLKRNKKKIAVLANFTYVHNHKQNRAYFTDKYKICMNDMYYFYKNICRGNFFGKIFMKVCIWLGTFEHFFIDIFWKIKKKESE